MISERSPSLTRVPVFFPQGLLLVALAGLFAITPAHDAHAAGDDGALFDASTTPAELLASARDAFGLGELDLAGRYYRELLVREPANLTVMLELSNVYERDGRLEYARGLLSRAARIAPSDTRVRNRRNSVDRLLASVLDREIEELLDAGHLDEALPRLSLLASIRPADPEVLARRARCFYRLGQLRAARDDMAKVVASDPSPANRRLRDEIAAALRSIETARLAAVARAAVDSARTPEEHSRAASAIARLLRADPENEWARDATRALPASQTPIAPDTTVIDAASIAAEHAAGEVATRAGKGARAFAGGVTRIARAGYSAAVRHPSVFPSALVLVLIFLFVRSPLPRKLLRPLGVEPALAGQFPPFSLPEVIHLLRSESHTGTLTIRAGRTRGLIYLESGEVVFCSAGRQTGDDALSTLLSASTAGRFAFSGDGRRREKNVKQPVDLILIEHARDSLPASSRNQSKPRRKSRVKELLESRSR